MTLPTIGITLGDPGGIGTEVTLKALAHNSTLPEARIILFGSRFVVEEEMQTLGLSLDIPPCVEKDITSPPRLSLYEVVNSIQSLHRGSPSAINGEASFRFFEVAVEKARERALHSLVTAPISKHSWSLAGVPYAGHTEYLAQIFPQAIMAFWSEKLKVALLSHHIPLTEAIQRIRKDELLDFFLRLVQTLSGTKIKTSRFLVAGLNPHAGEEGLMGPEELEEISPAITEARKKGMTIEGPFPPDVVFRQALGQPETMVIALTHDQGLIPFKMVAFDEGVNLTLGLPFVRTSPDHGTAFDIAGKGMANPKSMIEAINLTTQLERL
ncbi:4-hydroxythreonine-4-phosphate dehydrogenase PdxA [Acidobacteriota bacterium]